MATFIQQQKNHNQYNSKSRIRRTEKHRNHMAAAVMFLSISVVSTREGAKTMRYIPPTHSLATSLITHNAQTINHLNKIPDK